MAETPSFQAESTLTDKYQTTIPDSVRKVLHLEKRDRIQYTIQPNGQVVISRSDQPEPDPVLEQFLDFLAEDMRQNPQQIQPVSSELMNRLGSLVGDVEVDLDVPLSDEDE